MAEPDVMIGRTWVTVVTLTSLMFNGSIIAYLVIAGDGSNSLHTSALAWCFLSSLAILAGLGFGSISPLLGQWVKK